MKKIIFTLSAIFFLGTVTYGQDQHVVLISIDGLRPEFYKDPSWNMVNLRQAMQEGVYADGVDGVFPTVTYPSHTTMITGVKPLKHGVYYNTPFEPLGATGKWIWDYNTIKTPTIFSAAKAKGLKTASVYWPVSFNSPATWNFPEYWYLSDKKSRITLKALKENTTPAGLYE